MRHVDEVIIHCSATPPEWMAAAGVEAQRDEITRWHVEERGWRGIGYHWVIGRDGSEAIGRDLDRDGNPWKEIGAHVAGRNARTIGICLIGGHGAAAIDAFGDHFTPEQEAALLKRLAWLRQQFPTIKTISGHNDYAAKACPGFKVDRWLAGQPPKRTSLWKSMTLQASTVAKAATASTPVVAALRDVPWQTVAILSAVSVVALIATGVIDVERLKKWKAGDK